jgi:3-oxoacyl-[acyl-carrier protein] reductase
MDFSGKVVVVTGGASGIGGAATRAFAAAGGKVVFAWQTSADDAASIEAECHKAGHIVRGFPTDLRDPGAVNGLFERAREEFGPVDVLFANAGGLLARKRCVESTLDLWKEAMSINVYSAVLASQAALRQMEPRRSGSIVLMWPRRLALRCK